MIGQRPVAGFYPIYHVSTLSSGAEQADLVLAAEHRPEQMGSKRKFWLHDHQSSHWYLFKYSRKATGEHWSEKIACEIARILGLPHAEVELARHEASWGALVKDIRADRQRYSLLHGNELLLELDPTYPTQGTYRVSEHTVERVAQALSSHDVALPNVSGLSRELPPGVDDALGLFVGYLLLDAVIGNTDRHHENWAVVVGRDSSGSRILQLAPTYDHASSLGRELLDNKRVARIEGSHERGAQAYAARCRSAFYRRPGDPSPMSPIEAFLDAGRLHPAGRDAWLARCEEVGLGTLQAPLERLHPSCASEPAVAFARELIRYNCETLLGPKEFRK
jgi:hypothetical protein